MVDGTRNSIYFWGACHIKMGPWYWPSIRSLWFIKIVTQVIWALVIVASVGIFRKTDSIRKFMLYFPWIYALQMLYFFGYAFYAFSFPELRYLAEQELWFLKRYGLNQGPLAWPVRFYVFYPLAGLGFAVVLSIIWEAHLSYYRVLSVGGSGFEGKAFYEIHLQSGDTVQTLQDKWDSRLGIEKAKRDDLEDPDEEHPLFGGFDINGLKPPSPAIHENDDQDNTQYTS